MTVGLLRRDKLLDYADVERMADPFDAVPQIAPGAAAQTDAAGLMQVRRTPPARKGIGGLMARVFGDRTPGSIRLDERGTFFWRQIDGGRPLHEVCRRLAERFDLDRADARAATVLFVKALMLRGLIVLAVRRPAPAAGRENAP